MLVLSTTIGGLAGLVGMYLSYHLDISSGATIVLVNFALFMVVYTATGRAGHRGITGLTDHQHEPEIDLAGAGTADTEVEERPGRYLPLRKSGFGCSRLGCGPG